MTRAVAGLVALAGLLVAFLVFGRDEKPAGQAVKAPQVGATIEARAPLAGLRLTRELRASAPPVAMSSTAGGRGLLLAGTDGRVRVWDVNLGQEIDTLDYGDTGISSVDAGGGAIVAAGAVGTKYWLSAGIGTTPPGEIEIDEGDEQTISAIDEADTEAAFAPDGSGLLVVRDGKGRFESPFADDAAAPVFNRSLISVAYSPSGTAVLGVAVDGTVRLRDLDIVEDALPQPRGIERVLQAPGKIVSAAFSASGGQIVTASDDGTARVWYSADGEPRTVLATGRAPLSDARLSPDGQLVATAGRDGMLRVFSVSGERVAVARASLRPLAAVTWSADGQLLASASEDAVVRIWTNVAGHAPLSARRCSSAQYLFPAVGRDDGARGDQRQPYVASISCVAREGEAVRAPEAGTVTYDCGPITKSRVAIRTARGRCWVFTGVTPTSRSGSVQAGASIGEVVAAVDRIRVELWERAQRGHRVSNLWNPMLFLDVEPAKAPLYPGDNASQEAIARWMGTTAEEAGLPAELPVMAALTESGLKNLNFGDVDSIGFFQMRLGIWNQGEYAGFAERPDLQLKWFIDQAKHVHEAMRRRNRDPLGRPETYGEWAADVTRPPEQYRGRFQPKLPEAQRLLGLPVTSASRKPAAPEPTAGVISAPAPEAAAAAPAPVAPAAAAPAATQAP